MLVNNGPIFPKSQCRVTFRETGSQIVKEFIPANHGIPPEQETAAMQLFVDTHCRDKVEMSEDGRTILRVIERSKIDYFYCDHPEVKA